MNLSRPVRRGAAAVLAAALLGLGMSACGDDADSGASPSATTTADNGDVYNQADVDFATAMIPHHAQAIQMVTLTDGRTLDPAVKSLADQIRDAQVPEVETMTDWLTSWGEEIPATSLDHVHGGHDMSDMPSTGGKDGMPGMMSADQMQELADASDADFEDMWLQMMVEHHQGAIEMARTEKSDGVFPDAVALAGSIATSQQAEIEEIEQLLAR